MHLIYSFSANLLGIGPMEDFVPCQVLRNVTYHMYRRNIYISCCLCVRVFENCRQISKISCRDKCMTIPFNIFKRYCMFAVYEYHCKTQSKRVHSCLLEYYDVASQYFVLLSLRLCSCVCGVVVFT